MGNYWYLHSCSATGWNTAIHWFSVILKNSNFLFGNFKKFWERFRTGKSEKQLVQERFSSNEQPNFLQHFFELYFEISRYAFVLITTLRYFFLLVSIIIIDSCNFLLWMTWKAPQYSNLLMSELVLYLWRPKTLITRLIIVKTENPNYSLHYL